MNWQNRIVGHEVVEADQLLAHPQNFRRHPSDQREALRGSLKAVGWVGEVIVNRRSGYVLDGHCRIEEAMRERSSVPVCYVDLSPEEELLVLASHDRIGTMAVEDGGLYRQLLEQVTTPIDDALRLALMPPGTGGSERTDSPLRFVVIRAEDEVQLCHLLGLIGDGVEAEKSDLKRLAKFDRVRLLDANAVVDRLAGAR